LVALLILSKKPNGYSPVENPDVPGTVWRMVKSHDNSSFYLSLCHRLDYYLANYYSANYSLPSLSSPSPSNSLNDIGLGHIVRFDQQDMGTNDTAYFKLRSYKL